MTTLPQPIVQFVEDFEGGAANFGASDDNFIADLADDGVIVTPSGGVGDSAQLTTSYALDSPSEVVFRGEAILESSDLAFTGDWIAGGVDRLSLFVQHDAPIPLQFAVRVATQISFPFASDNFPGAFVGGFDPVEPNTLTELSAEISPRNLLDPANFQFGQIGFFEGGDFASLFSDVTNLQVTVELPDGFTAVGEDLVNAAAANASIELPTGTAVGDVFDRFTVVEGVLLVDELGDPILDDQGGQQFVDLEVPELTSTAIFNTGAAFTFGLDNVSITPEPMSGLLGVIAGLVAAPIRRRPRT